MAINEKEFRGGFYGCSKARETLPHQARSSFQTIKKALPPPWDERLVILTQFHRCVTASASLSPNRLWSCNGNPRESLLLFGLLALKRTSARFLCPLALSGLAKRRNPCVLFFFIAYWTYYSIDKGMCQTSVRKIREYSAPVSMAPRQMLSFFDLPFLYSTLPNFLPLVVRYEK